MAQAHKKHEHSNEFFFIVRQLEDFFPLNLHVVSASYLFLTIFLSSVLHLSFMTPSIFSPYYYTCFFFPQGILQVHATYGLLLVSLFSYKSVNMPIFFLVFASQFLSFFTWVFLTWISGFISPLYFCCFCFLCYGLFLSVFSLMDIFFPWLLIWSFLSFPSILTF